MNPQSQLSFGERHARGASVGLLGLALVAGMAAFGPSPSRMLLFAVVFVLACMPWIRKRQMQEEQRRNEVMEDERDRVIQLRATSRAHAVLATGAMLIAIVLCIPALKQALLAGELALPGILVLLVIVSSLSGHASVIASCRAERR